MQGPLILALDLGLTNAKCVVFRPDGSLVGRESVPYPTHRPASVRVEQDPDDWWTALVDAARSVESRAPMTMRAVEAIGVTGHMHGLVLEDHARRPIGRAIVLGDRRATAEAGALAERLGPASIARTTGATLDPSMPAAELRWLAEREPDRLRRAALVTSPKDHLRGRLTDDRLTEPIDACATALYDIRARRWWTEMCAAVGVGPERLPQVVAPETVAGRLRDGPAAELGVSAGVPVVVGAGDDVEVLGGGLVEPGEVLEHLGTTGSMLTVSGEPLDDPSHALELYPHVLPDRWVVGGSLTTAGAALGWVADLLGFGCIEATLHTLDGDRGPDPERSSVVFVPSLAGDRSPTRDPAARGAWLGLDATFERSDLARSALEGVCFGLARILHAIEDLLGSQRRIVVSATGAGLDPRWLAVRATAYGRPLVTLDTPEPTALGLAMVVAAGARMHPDIRAAVSVMSRRLDEVAPGARSGVIRARRAASDRGVGALRPLWPRLAG